jgi:hypothetical protein
LARPSGKDLLEPPLQLEGGRTLVYLLCPVKVMAWHLNHAPFESVRQPVAAASSDERSFQELRGFPGPLHARRRTSLVLLLWFVPCLVLILKIV